MKILAVDSNSIMNRAFYGIKVLTTKDGFFTNAIYGFLSILLTAISETEPDAIVFAFDVHAPTFRHEFYKEYINANFDNSIFNHFYADDFLEGDLDNSISLNLADLRIQHTTGSGKNSQTITLFQGIFAYTECQKDIGTYIKISKNSAKLGFYPGTRDEKLLDSQIGNLLSSKLGGRIAVE